MRRVLSPSPVPTRSRRGIVLWVVTSLVLVMGILFFSFHLMVRNRNAQAHAVYFGEVAYGLAESGAALAWRQLRRHRGDEGSPIYQALVEPEPATLGGMVLPLDLSEALDVLLRDMGRDVEVEVSAHVVSASPLGARKDLSQGYDPLEKRAVVEVEVRARFRGVHRRVLERREVRVQLDTLPVLSKFTLFVREPETEAGGSPGYNVYANDINGVPDSLTVARERNLLPLILYNHGDRFARIDHDVEENGWVFLGGSEPVRLNLTSGADYLHGQYFHFFNFLANERSRQPAFVASEPPAFFRRDHLVEGATHEYVLKHVIYGYFTVDRGTPPGTMNRGGLLDRYFAGGGNMRSSVLHLFGSFLSPSPTRVLGDVRQSYPIYTGITVDVDRDGRRDGLVRLLPALERSGWAAEAAKPFPSRIRSLSRKGEAIALDPELLDLSAMFGGYEGYARYMSALVRDEPYNWSVDYIRSRGEFPIERPTLDPGRDYPNPGTDVTLRRRGEVGPDSVHFRGDLHQLDPGALERRALLRFPDAAAFSDAFLRPGEPLRLGVPVLVEQGDLELPDRLLVERGGVIMTRKGDIRFDGVTCEAGERLVLVALDGDITSDFDHASDVDLAQVDLVAPRGRVAVTDRNHLLAIRGILAVRTLRPEDFPSGGRVVFPVEADPTHPDRGRFARVHVADAPRSWGL